MRPLPLLFALVVTAAPMPGVDQLWAQPAPAFDAVSIRENKTVSQDGRISGPTPGRFTVTNSSVASMIRYAYRLRTYQLIGLPEWASRQPYDVVATYAEGTPLPTDDQVRRMLQTLLADRFGLQVHRETRQLPVYELRVARADGRLGPQLVVSALDCERNPPPAAPGSFAPCQGFQSRSLIAGKGGRLDALASALEAMLKQRVLNRTGLSGLYDYNLRWRGARGPAEDANVDEVAAMMTALQDQLGLKLESARAPDDVVVVDAIRRPTAN